MDSNLDQTVRTLLNELESTAELPIDPIANRWLGEAEALARDLARSDVSTGVVRKRFQQIQYLLNQIDECNNPTATSHVDRAKAIVNSTLETQNEL